MKIVQPSEPVRFVALSYMWESSEGAGHAQLENANAHNLETPGSLTSVTLPPIITDTISLCRDLGERYLWVDRLCIVQDDEHSKPNQIDGMDRIYQSASFAIMAALNDRNGNGFPGYAGNPRRPRASLWGPARNRNVGRGIDPNGMQAVVDASLWNRRGWTFQEKLLSKRRLFITEYQVLFECCRGQAAEELTWGRPLQVAGAVNEGEPSISFEEDLEDGVPDIASESTREDTGEPATTGKSHRMPRIPGFFRRPLYHKDATIKLREHVTLANYCAWVEDYTSRQLSRSADILNAFAGVGNAVRKALRTETLFGLPEVYLPQALMWSHTGAALLREDDGVRVPSWSWAAWTAAEGSAAGYRWVHGNARLVDVQLVRIATLVSFHLRDPTAVVGSENGDGGLRKLRVKERWLGMEMKMTKIHGPEKLPPCKGKWAGASPWEALAHEELDAKAVAMAGDFPGALVFNTTVASLRVGRGRGIRKAGGSREAGAEHEDAEILDMMGRQVGYLDKMDPAWVAGRKGARDRRKMLDFIVISASLDGGLSERNEWAFIEGQFHEMWRFNVMLVERLPFEPFVARRVGVGHVRCGRITTVYFTSSSMQSTNLSLFELGIILEPPPSPSPSGVNCVYAIGTELWFGTTNILIHRPNNRSVFTALKLCDPPDTCATHSVLPCRDPVDLRLEQARHGAVLLRADPELPVAPPAQRAELLDLGVLVADVVFEGQADRVEDAHVTAQAVEDPGALEGEEVTVGAGAEAAVEHEDPEAREAAGEDLAVDEGEGRGEFQVGDPVV
ncbi:hypothetical protein Ct61P_13082 [Colletotrichum tofieldiae]|nr:hypothetical protein Ct61P_13082 [Colletotrichum tofieldiae]